MRKELIRRQVVVNSTTTKFIYSTEFLVYARTTYHIACNDFYYKWDTEHRWGKHRGGLDCTAYETEEEARMNIRATALHWNWNEEECFIKVYNGEEHVTKHHRNKVKG